MIHILDDMIESVSRSAPALVGADRYATSTAVASKLFATSTAVGVATGLAFPDALAASPYLGSRGSPVVLVPASGALPVGTTGYLTSLNKVGSVTVFGGIAAVSDQIASAVQAAVG